MPSATRSYAGVTGLPIDDTKTARTPLGQTSGTTASDAPPEKAARAPGAVETPPVAGASPVGAWPFGPKDGELLAMVAKSEQQAARWLMRRWEEQDDRWAYARARWDASAKRRAGLTGVQILKPDADRAVYRVYVPPGADKAPPTFNKPARLCRRLVSNLMVDPPAVECVPGVGADPEDPDATEMATRVGQELAGPTVLNVPKVMRRALSLACTYDSAFVHVWTDPTGGGHRPKAIQASAKAMTEDDAVLMADGQTMQPDPYVTRYVREDKSLTDKKREAAREWLPKLCREVLTGQHVRPMPATAVDLDECDGILIASFQPLRRLRQFPRIAALSDDRLAALAGHRPKRPRDFLPPGSPEPKGAERERPDDPIPDDAQFWTIRCYIKGGTPAHPLGAYVIAVGGADGVIAHAQKWSADLDGAETPLLLPLAQFKQFEEGEVDFYGRGMMHLLGPGGEVRASIVGTAIDHLYKFNFRKTFYSPNSLFQPKTAQMLGPYVPIADGTQPKTEEIPEFPTMGMPLLDATSAELDDEAGLAPVAQGQRSPEVKSGLHAQTLIEQVNVGLSDIRQNTEDGFVTLLRVALQQCQAFYTVPQLVRVGSDENTHKTKEFIGADLSADMDVRIAKGTMTMLAPSAKMAVAEHMFTLGLIDQAELKRIASGNLGGALGVTDYPPLLRIRRQLERWHEGPPEGATPPTPPDPMTGLPGAPGDPAWQEAVASIFDPLPNDVEPTPMGMPGAPQPTPGIAALRLRELSLAMCTTKFSRQPKPWQDVLVAEYVRMRGAAGLQPLTDDLGNLPAPLPIDPATGQPLATPEGMAPDGSPVPPTVPGIQGGPAPADLAPAA